MVHRTWRRLEAQGDVPPPKYLPAIARKGDHVYMFGGLYRGEKRVFPTPCTFSYDLAGNRWTYHHAVPPPYQETGLWGASAFYDAVADVFYILGGLVGWPFGELMDFLASGPGGWDSPEWPRNDKVYVFRLGERGAGGQPGAPGKPGVPRGGKPGRPEEEGPPREPEEPEEPYPNLADCAITHGLDERGIPVDREPTFTSSDTTATWWIKLSPLCEEVEIRVEVYSAPGHLFDTMTTTPPNPAAYGVRCLRSYSTSWEFALGSPGSRPSGTWWVEVYIDGVLSCTRLFEVEG
jgi:hypothetical protein